MSPGRGLIPRLTDRQSQCDSDSDSTRGGFEYLHHNPAICSRRRKGNPVPRGITGPPCFWTIEVRVPGPPGWESVKPETVEYGHESRETRTR
jgi:hypothetical protein